MVAAHPLGCKQQVTVAVVCLTLDNCERKGEKTDRWLLGYVLIWNTIQVCQTEYFFALGNRVCAWVPYEGIKAATPEMLCKTWIVLSDEYSAMDIPNRATANETRSLHAHRKVSVRYFTLYVSRRGGKSVKSSRLLPSLLPLVSHNRQLIWVAN